MESYTVATLPKTGGLVYVASPYSHAQADIRHFRMTTAALWTAKLLDAGHLAISPIVASHAPSLHMATPGVSTDFNCWVAINHRLIDASCAVVVLMLPGWGESRGIADEVAYAADRGIPVYYLQVAPLVDVLGR